MPLFVCDNCKTIENTACGYYWGREEDFFGTGKTDALCSACMPSVYSDGSKCRKGGGWHGRFKRVIATPETINGHGRDNFIYTSDVLKK
jgi:hypothetical protein